MRNKLLTDCFVHARARDCRRSFSAVAYRRMQTAGKKNWRPDPQMKHAILSLYVEDIKTGACFSTGIRRWGSRPRAARIVHQRGGPGYLAGFPVQDEPWL